MNKAFCFLTGINGYRDEEGVAHEVAVRRKTHTPSPDKDISTVPFFTPFADSVRKSREQEPGDPVRGDRPGASMTSTPTNTRVNPLIRFWAAATSRGGSHVLLGALVALPGLHLLARAVYWCVARTRRYLPESRDPCRDGTCRVGRNAPRR